MIKSLILLWIREIETQWLMLIVILICWTLITWLKRNKFLKRTMLKMIRCLKFQISNKVLKCLMMQSMKDRTLTKIIKASNNRLIGLWTTNNQTRAISLTSVNMMEISLRVSTLDSWLLPTIFWLITSIVVIKKEIKDKIRFKSKVNLRNISISKCKLLLSIEDFEIESYKNNIASNLINNFIV